MKRTGLEVDAMEKDHVFAANNLRFTLGKQAKSLNIGNVSGDPDLDRNAAYELASTLLSAEGKWPGFLKLGNNYSTRERSLRLAPPSLLANSNSS